MGCFSLFPHGPTFSAADRSGMSGKEEAVPTFRELFQDKRDLHDILSRCLGLWRE